MDKTDRTEKFYVKHIIKNVISEWCLSSTSHGLPNIIRADSIILKIIWIICFTASLFACLYSIANGIRSYTQYNSYVSNQIIQEIPTNFPAVSLCSLKYTNKTSASDYLKSLLFINETPIYGNIPFQSI